MLRFQVSSNHCFAMYKDFCCTLAEHNSNRLKYRCLDHQARICITCIHFVHLKCEVALAKHQEEPLPADKGAVKEYDVTRKTAGSKILLTDEKGNTDLAQYKTKTPGHDLVAAAPTVETLGSQTSNNSNGGLQLLQEAKQRLHKLRQTLPDLPGMLQGRCPVQQQHEAMTALIETLEKCMLKWELSPEEAQGISTKIHQMSENWLRWSESILQEAKRGVHTKCSGVSVCMLPASLKGDAPEVHMITFWATVVALVPAFAYMFLYL